MEPSFFFFTRGSVRFNLGLDPFDPLASLFLFVRQPARSEFFPSILLYVGSLILPQIICYIVATAEVGDIHDWFRFSFSALRRAYTVPGACFTGHPRPLSGSFQHGFDTSVPRSHVFFLPHNHVVIEIRPKLFHSAPCLVVLVEYVRPSRCFLRFGEAFSSIWSRPFMFPVCFGATLPRDLLRLPFSSPIFGPVLRGFMVLVVSRRLVGLPWLKDLPPTFRNPPRSRSSFSKEAVIYFCAGIRRKAPFFL